MILLILAYILFISIFIILNIKKIHISDLIMIVISSIILIISFYYKPSIKETFIDKVQTLDDILSQYQPINLEEDYSSIKKNLVVYTTAFNDLSYKTGTTWNNLFADSVLNKNFNFEINPIFSRKNGFYMGNNRIIGPYSNLLDIDFVNTFTIVLCCKHGNLVTSNISTEIELIKLYANSPNNNALTLFIQSNSLQQSNNIQTGTLLFQESSNDPIPCLISPNDTVLNFEQDTLTFYFIIKGTDYMRILTMNEKTNTIYELLRFNMSNTDITFSNKEIIFNRFKNWNASIFNFAIYNSALSDDEITSYYNHTLTEYQKYTDPNFQAMVSQYNSTIATLANFLKCPYDKPTCDSCKSITKWNDVTQLLSASSTCRKSINDYCAINTGNPLCTCWNTSSTVYNTDNCKLYRAIFNGSTSWLENLSPTDLEFIKSKYGFLYPEECPKPIVKPDVIDNAYDSYDYDKIRITLNNKQTYDTDLDWNDLKIKSDDNLPDNDLKINNVFNQNQDTKIPPVISNGDDKKINNPYENQQTVKNMYANTPTSGSLLNYFKDNQTPSTSNVKDSFFSKFMKIN
jgi:hypothetical protein